MSGGADGGGPASEARAFWEARYGEQERIWSGRANGVLVDVVAPLPPGTALDLGCGEGGDAVWLALRGWQVLAVDISATALSRLTAHAAEAGVGDRITVERHDLEHSLPEGEFDLVSAQYLHSPVAFDRDSVLRAAAAAVAPGGLLLVVGHAAPPPWARHQHEHEHDRHYPEVSFPTGEEVLASLDLEPGGWDVERLGLAHREATGPGGVTGPVADSVVAVRRRRR